jgi:hypothetical protein
MIEENFISTTGDGIHTWTNTEGTKFTATELEGLAADMHLSEKERKAIEHVVDLLRRLDAHLPSFL